MCIIPSHCSNLLQYSKLQLAKAVDRTYFVQVYNTCIPHEPAIGKHEYPTSTQKFVSGYTEQRALFLCQLSVVEHTQSCTIWGTYTVWPYMVFSVCFQTYVFHHILYSGKFLREKTFVNCSLLLPTDAEKLSRIGTKIKRTSELCCCKLRSYVILVKRIRF